MMQAFMHFILNLQSCQRRVMMKIDRKEAEISAHNMQEEER